MDSDDQTFPMLEIPEIAPAMTLSDTVLFPHALMPLFIFEERYQKMLEDVLATNRLMVIVQEDSKTGEDGFEPCHPIGTIGVVRASHANEDGTSHLVLQGLARVKVKKILTDSPYRKLEIEPIYPSAQDASEDFEINRSAINELVLDCERIQSQTPKEFIDFLDSIEEPPAYLDVAIQTLCVSSIMKQRLLETIDIKERYLKFISYLEQQRAEEKLFKKLQGETGSEEIPLN